MIGIASTFPICLFTTGRVRYAREAILFFGFASRFLFFDSPLFDEPRSDESYWDDEAYDDEAATELSDSCGAIGDSAADRFSGILSGSLTALLRTTTFRNTARGVSSSSVPSTVRNALGIRSSPTALVVHNASGVSSSSAPIVIEPLSNEMSVLPPCFCPAGSALRVIPSRNWLPFNGVVGG